MVLGCRKFSCSSKEELKLRDNVGAYRLLEFDDDVHLKFCIIQNVINSGILTSTMSFKPYSSSSSSTSIELQTTYYHLENNLSSSKERLFLALGTINNISEINHLSVELEHHATVMNHFCLQHNGIFPDFQDAYLDYYSEFYDISGDDFYDLLRRRNIAGSILQWVFERSAKRTILTVGIPIPDITFTLGIPGVRPMITVLYIQKSRKLDFLIEQFILAFSWIHTTTTTFLPSDADICEMLQLNEDVLFYKQILGLVGNKKRVKFKYLKHFGCGR